MASWVGDIQSKIFTIVSYKGKAKYQSKYPNIFYTSDHSENKDHGIQSHHFMANRWRNSGRI